MATTGRYRRLTTCTRSALVIWAGHEYTRSIEKLDSSPHNKESQNNWSLMIIGPVFVDYSIETIKYGLLARQHLHIVPL